MTNKNRKNFFKGFLATTSAFAVIAGASNSVMGAQYTTDNGGNVVLRDGAAAVNAVDHPAGNGGNWADDDSFFWGHARDLRLGTVGGGATVATLDLNNEAGRIITVRNDSSIASLVDSSVNNRTAALVVNDGITLTLGGNAGLIADGNAQVAGDFAGLGNITLGSGGGGSVLTIDTNATFDGTIDSDANDDGVININAGKRATFNGVVGGQAIGEINLLGNQSIAEVNANLTAGTLDFHDALSGIFVDNGITVNADFDSNGAAGNGQILFVGGGTINGTIGVANALANVEAQGAGVVQLNGAVEAAILKVSNAGADVRLANANALTGDVSFTADGTVQVANNGIITGAVDNAGNAAAGKLIFAGAGTVTQAIGGNTALTLVEASGAGVVQLGNAINIATLNVKSGATVQAADNSAAAIAAINLGTAGVGGGGGTLEIDANVGDYNLPGGAVTFLHADSLLKLTNTKNLDRTVTLNADLAPGGGVDLTGKLEIHSNGTNDLDVAIAAAETIGTDKTHRLNELIVSGDQDTTIAPDIFAKTITVSSTADVTFGGAIDSGANSAINFTAAGNTAFNNNVIATTLAFAGNARIVTVADNKTLTVNTITSGAGNGSRLVLAGDTDIVLGGAQAVAVDLITAAANGNTVNLGAGAYTVPDIQLINVGGTLKLADGFELTGGINVAAGNAATVEFLGDGTATGALGGAGSAVGAVTVAANGSTLQLGGNVNAASLDGDAGGAGHVQNLKFINAGNITVTGAVGANAAFAKIEFGGGGGVTFGAGDLTTGQELNFTANTEVVTDNYDLGATNIINANGVNGSKLTVNVDQTITGDIGTSAIQPFGTLHVDGKIPLGAGSKDVKIQTANFYAGVTGDADVIFDEAGGSSVSFLGSAGARVNSVDFVQDGRVRGEVRVEDDIDVRAGKTATFDGIVFEGDGMTMYSGNAGNARADFTAKVVLNMPILANAGGDGIIDFKGGVNLQQNIGVGGANVASVTIGGDSTINANIHSNAIDVGGHEITLANDKTFDGVTAFNGTTITLGEHDLTMTNGNVTFTGASTINTTVDGNNLGNLVADAGSKIILQGADTLAVEVDDAKALPVNALPVNGQALKLIAKTGGGALNIDLSQVTVTATGAFSKWEKAIVADELVLTQNSQVQEVITESISSAGLSDVISSEVAEVIENFEEDTSGEDFVLQLNQMTKPNIADAVARTANTTANEVSAVNLNTINVVTDTISARIADVTSFASLPISTPVISSPAVAPTVSAPVSSPATAPTTGRGTSPVKTGIGKNIKVSSENSYIAGVAAGDDHARFGVWATPFYSKSTQKKRSGTSGFKADSYGGTFGVDTKANDNMIIGLAFSAMNTDIKHKDFKSGDKTKVTSFLVSAYATHQFTNNWFGQGVFSMGSSSVNNKENRRISNTQLAIAEGKYNSMMFAAEILGGYNHVVNNKFVVTPMLGLNYNRINDGGYTESGSNAGPQLMEVTKRASQKLDVVGGIRLTAMPFMTNGVEITPEAHAFVRHDVIGKGAKVNAKIPGLSLPSEKAKLQKTFYSVGASVNAAYGAMDYGVSADANFANKYVGVQGSVKVRVNF